MERNLLNQYGAEAEDMLLPDGAYGNPAEGAKDGKHRWDDERARRK
jgi:hypothetical protein